MILLSILGVILAVTPLLISQQLQKWVLANGADRVTVQNVDFNPFTAELGLYDIEIERSGYRSFLLPELELKARWKDIFQRRFVIEKVSLNGVQLTVDRSLPRQERVGGILLKKLIRQGANEPEPGAQDKPWYVQLQELQLKDFKLVYKDPVLQSVIDVEALSLSNLDTDPSADPAQIVLKGAIDNAPLALEGMLNLFSSHPGFEGRMSLERLAINPYLALLGEGMQQNNAIVSIDSRLDVAQTPEKGFRVSQTGDLGFDQVLWQDSALHVEAQQLNWTGEVAADISAQNAVRVRTDGRLGANGLAFEERTAQLALQDQQLVWEGSSETALSPAGDLQVTLNGQLRNTQLAIDMPAQQLQLGNDQLSWQGELSLRAEQEQLALESSGSLDLSGLGVHTRDTKERLVQADRVQADGIAIQSVDAASVAQVTVNGLSMGQEQRLQEFDATLPGFANHEALVLEQVDWSAETGVHIASVVLNGLRHALVKTESGEWSFDSFIQASERLAAGTDDAEVVGAAAEDPAADRETRAEQAPAVRIDAVRIGQGSALYIVDRSYPEPFVQKIDIDAFRMTGIDSGKSMASSDLELAAKLADGSIDVKGQVALFAAEPTFDLKGDVQALSLLPYDLFLKKFIGYEVESGSLNAETSLSAKGGKLDSNTELALHQLDIRALTEEELKAIGATQDAGLEAGLSMLKDKNQTIELKVPVQGAFDNLRVDPGDIINQALGTALQSGAKTYLAAALFPFGTLQIGRAHV